MSKSSVVWDYFTLIGDQVKCGICRLSMKLNRSSTSNMMRHLRTKHSTVDLKKRRILPDEADEPDEPDSIESDTNSVRHFL